MKNLFVFAFCMLFVVFAFGCAPKVSKVSREIGQLNLQYNSPEQPGARIDKAIALVSPEVLKPQSNAPLHSQGATNSPIVTAMIQQKLGVVRADFSGIYARDYASKVKTAIGNGVQDILSKRGFNLMGPYETFDDMPYNDKKKAYLALVPVLNLQIENKITKEESSNFTHIYTTEGVVSIGGELLINLIEPMTKERIMSKRINLSDFNISRNYVRQTKIGSGGIIVDAITSGNELTDNSDKMLTEAINEFYTQAMAKIDKMISVEEIVSYEKSVEELKGLKRF